MVDTPPEQTTLNQTNRTKVRKVTTVVFSFTRGDCLILLGESTKETPHSTTQRPSISSSPPLSVGPSWNLILIKRRPVHSSCCFVGIRGNSTLLYIPSLRLGCPLRPPLVWRSSRTGPSRDTFLDTHVRTGGDWAPESEPTQRHQHGPIEPELPATGIGSICGGQFGSRS